MTDRSDLGSIDGVVETSMSPDMGLFPPAAERAFRFMCSDSIKSAVHDTTGPIHIVSVEPGFPWGPAMQVNEHLKRSDAVGNQVAAKVASDLQAEGRDVQRAVPLIKPFVRAVVTGTFYEPDTNLTDPTLKASKRYKALVRHYTEKLLDADTINVHVNEPDDKSYVGRGAWTTIQPRETEPLLAELVGRLGTVDVAETVIRRIGHLTAVHSPQVRPFKISVLNTRSAEELLQDADLMYEEYPEVTETSLFHEAVALAKNQIQPTDENDLSAIDNDSATVMIINHWPLRHKQNGEAESAGWAYLVAQMHDKLQTNGIGIFFPWNLPRAFDPEHPEITQSGVQSMLLNEFGLKVDIDAEPAAALIKSIAKFGEVPAMLAPQFYNSPTIGRLIVTKSLTLSEKLESK